MKPIIILEIIILDNLNSQQGNPLFKPQTRSEVTLCDPQEAHVWRPAVREKMGVILPAAESEFRECS